MKKDYKKNIILIFIILIILLLGIFIIIVCNLNKKAYNETNNEKIFYEIKYLDSEIIYMIDMINNMVDEDNSYIYWNNIRNSTNNIYIYWNSIILDLNNLDIDKKDLTMFGKYLDNLLISIKNNDKENTCNYLLELYKKIIIYAKSLNNDIYNTILDIKFNLLKSYSIVEMENWTITHEYIKKASKGVSDLVNSMENNKYNQNNINQAYVAVKELENLINIKDIDVFYFKYKIALQKLENIEIKFDF